MYVLFFRYCDDYLRLNYKAAFNLNGILEYLLGHENSRKIREKTTLTTITITCKIEIYVFLFHEKKYIKTNKPINSTFFLYLKNIRSLTFE